jgi:hypothetical protein
MKMSETNLIMLYLLSLDIVQRCSVEDEVVVYAASRWSSHACFLNTYSATWS